MKAFIFDLDGTLLDSMGAWKNLGYEYLYSKGIKNIEENLRETLRTMSLLETANYFMTEYSIKLSAEQIYNEINKLIEVQYKYNVQPKDGVLEFLEKHKDRKMCIATATDRFLVEHALKRIEIEDYFDFIITSSEVGNSKENPDIFIRAAEMLAMDIDKIIVFEDALHAIKSAKSAGFYTVGIYEKCFEDDQDRIKTIADEYIENLNELNVIDN